MTVPRVLFQGGVGATLRVSLPGYDVTTADIDHLVFNSSYSGLSLVKRGSIGCSIKGSATVYWDVGQEHVPWVIWRCKFPTDVRYFGPWIYNGVGGANDYIKAIATTGYITFSILQSGIDATAIIDYVAFKNVDPS